MNPQDSRFRVDMKHYKANKDRLDAVAKQIVDSGRLQELGFPQPLLNFARGVATVLDKYPELGRDEVLQQQKPLTGSEKRRAKREGATKVDDVRVQLEEGDDRYKITPYEDWKEPPPARYVKDGKTMPEGWKPIKLESQPTACGQVDGRAMEGPVPDDFEAIDPAEAVSA